MSNTPIQEQPAQRLSSGSLQTLPSRPLQPTSDPSASKRVCFYKSGDYKFSGHRMVINARTFKTFDALLDALSKKVPLPFGVRTITTPRGTHLVKGLDDLHDGGSYVCSDQKRVKPLNLDEVNRRQVPWNTTRPPSAARRQKRQGPQFGRGNEINNRSAKVTERVAVRTPKRLVVIKNKDPTVKRRIVLQRRTAPTFDALLDYLSQILQFPVLKLYSTEGIRVDGLASLILCSGVVVAAGNEPFRLGNYSFHRTGQMAQAMETLEQPRAQNNKSFLNGRSSRNFSLSSERYIVNQINKSLNGSMNSHLHHRSGSHETEVNPHRTSTGRLDAEHPTCIVPHEDDIEKSFRVNQDGSMTVEMKVHLTVKEEEILHWTTTLSRSSLSKRTVCASISESGNSSPNSNNTVAKDSSEGEMKEENHPAGAGKIVGFNEERVYEGYTSKDLGKAKTSFKHTPTPGPRYVKKKASVESVKMVTESGVQENTLGQYSYIERTADGESAEGYCVVRHNSSSNRPVPKPRKTPSAGASNKGSHSFTKSSGVAEVLQIQNNGMEVTETVMHIYESQGCYDNYLANEDYSTDDVSLHGSPPVPDSKPSTESGPCSSSNDIDFSWQPPTADSLQRQKEEMLSLSSEPVSSAQILMNNLSSVNQNKDQIATNSQTKKTVKEAQTPKTEKNKKNHKSLTSTSSSDKKQKKIIVSPSKSSKHSSTDKHSSNASMGKKSLSSSESAKNGQSSKGAEMKAEKPKKSVKDENIPRKDSALLVSTENVKKTPAKRQSINKVPGRDNGHNVNTPTERPQMKKNMSDILQPKKSLLLGKKTVSKPKSMSENRIPSPKQTLELNESVSMPSLNPTPSEIHQYVENWLEKVSPDQLPYTEETIKDEFEPQTKVVFQIGGDSDVDENSKCQTNLDEYYTQPSDAIKKSASCLSVPLCHEGPATSLLHNEQKTRGLCVSMPSVRVDPVHQENRLRAHKSAEDIDGQAGKESSSSNLLSPRAKIKPVLRQLCSSIQCIRRVSDTHKTSNLEKSNSLPDFSTQVASVFGSSCKAFLSFLSVMTLRESLTGSGSGDGQQSRSTSEAMLMMESLQKISVIEDEEEQRASLTDLQSRASSQFREHWKDFLILRERLESEPLSPRVSETEFALDVVSEGGDVFEDQQMGLDELMEELNMPEDLRAEISSTIQQAKTFYPVEESTFVETERNQSDSEDEVEQFVKEYKDETKQSPEFDITQKKQSNDNIEIDHSEETNTMWELEKAGLDVKDSEVSDIDEPLSRQENGTDEKEDQVEEDRREKDGEDDDTKEINDDNDVEEFENTQKEGEEETEWEAVKEDDEGQDQWEAENGSHVKSVEKVEKGTDEETTVDELEEEGEKLEEKEKEVFEETEEEIRDEQDRETSQGNSVEETDEREFAAETEEEKKGEEDFKEGETEEEADEADEEEEKVGNIEEQDQKEKEVEGEYAPGAETDVEGEMEEVVEETDEGEEAENIEEAEEKEKEEKEEEETDVVTENSVEEVEEVIEETDQEEEVQNIIDGLAENKEVDVVVEDVEEAKEVVEETDEEELENVIGHVDEEEREKEIEINMERDKEAETEEYEEKEEDGDVEIENTEERKAMITDESEEKDEITDENEEKDKLTDENEEKEEITDENEEKDELTDENEEKEEITDENEEKDEISDENEEKEEITDENEEKGEIKDDNEEKDELTDENEEKVEITDENEEKEEIKDDNEEKDELTDESEEKGEIKDDNEEKDELTDESEEKEEITDGNEEKDELTDESEEKEEITDGNEEKDELTDENKEKGEIKDDNEEKDEITDENEEKEEITDENEGKDEISDENEEKEEITDENEEKGEIKDDNEEKDEITDENEEKEEITDENEEKDELTDESEEKGEIKDDNEEKDELTDESEEKEEITDGNEEKDELTDESEEKEEITDGNEEKDELTDENKEKGEIKDDNEEKDEITDENEEKEEITDENEGKDEISDENEEKEEITDENEEKGEIKDDNEEKDEITDENEEKEEITDENEEKDELTDESEEKGEIKDDNEEKDELTDESEEKEEITDGNEEKDEITDENEEKGEIKDDNEEKDEITDENEEKEEITDENEEKDEITDGNEEKDELTDENEEKGEIKDDNEEKDELTDESEEKEEITDDNEEKDELTDESEEKDELTDGNEEKDELTDENEEKEEITDGNEEKDEITDGNEEKDELTDENEEKGEITDDNEEKDEITDENEEKDEIRDESEETDKDIEEEEKCDELEESKKESEEVSSLEKESVEVRDEVEEIEIEDSIKGGRMLDEGQRADDEENELNERLEQVDKQDSNDEIKEANVSEDVDSFTDLKDRKNLLDTVSYLQQHSGSSKEVNGRNSESPSKYSSDVQCEDDKGNGTDTINELEADEREEHHEEGLSSQPHPVEISQELLDFVNTALQSSSLIFTYDSRGNVRIEPDNARVVQTQQIIIPKSSDDSLYGLNCLPSPSTSDLSEYRPETSESGGYQTQESVDIVSESGDEASEKPFLVCRRKTGIPNGILSVVSNVDLLESSRLKSAETSYDSVSKASREDLSYFSAASSLKADAEAAPEVAQCSSFISEKDSADGILIDQGRWLLRENHLIRKSPPVSIGMYGNLDSTSLDTGQENNSEDSPPHYKTQHNPLAVISSSELEEMAKPQTPKCTYYNMPHGSDSDPFLDDSSIKSGKKDTNSVKGRGSRVSPVIDTSKTWANKNGSLSSFASVEFKIPDRRVHPEGDSSAVTQARGTSSAGASVLQGQDSVETDHVRCSQYCPIL